MTSPRPGSAAASRLLMIRAGPGKAHNCDLIGISVGPMCVFRHCLTPAWT